MNTMSWIPCSCPRQPGVLLSRAHGKQPCLCSWAVPDAGAESVEAAVSGSPALLHNSHHNISKTTAGRERLRS